MLYIILQKIKMEHSVGQDSSLNLILFLISYQSINMLVMLQINLFEFLNNALLLLLFCKLYILETEIVDKSGTDNH